MSGPAPGWTCTRTGAVKYDRPVKKFLVTDLARIAEKVTFRAGEGPAVFSLIDRITTRYLEFATEASREQFERFFRALAQRFLLTPAPEGEEDSGEE
jgi:hypothetical protein